MAVDPRALYEYLSLEKRAKRHRVNRLKLTVLVTTAARRRATLTDQVTNLHL